MNFLRILRVSKQLREICGGNLLAPRVVLLCETIFLPGGAPAGILNFCLMKKWIVILLIIVGGGFWIYKQQPKWKANSDAASADLRPKTAVVEQRDIRFSVPAAGEISPAEQVSVKPEINGRIEELPVDLGDQVKKGQLLFSLDDKELQNQKASSITEIERAKLQLQQAERNYKRAQELFEANLIAQELYENTKTEFELAKNALERSQREL